MIATLPVDIVSGMPDSVLPKMVIEAFCGQAPLTAACARLGFTVRAYEKYPDGKKGEALSEGDLGHELNQKAIEEDIKQGRVYHTHLAPDCGTFGPMSNMNGTTRTSEHPEGDGAKDYEKAGNFDHGDRHLDLHALLGLRVVCSL